MKPNILMDKYELGRLVGQGTFGKVYHARNLKTGDTVAIKAMDKQKVLKVGMIKQIKREISAMRLVRHPNIVRIYEVMATKSKIYIVMEHLKGGELFSRVSEEGRLEDEEARKYFQQLISAVDFCHSRGVYHRDLKLENLLLDDNGVMKVCDFGLSALPDQIRQDGLLHTACGTPNYVAPEVITKKGYDGAKADIWSCGVILFALLAGYLPFHDANLMALYKKIHSCDLKFPQWFSLDVQQLILRFLDPNPGTRITVAQLKQVSWFQRGFKPPRPDNDPNVGLLDDVDLAFCVPKPARLNAFGIISLSPAFNLSGLFEDKIVKQDLWFTSTHPAWSIISKLEEIARMLRFSVKKSDDCKVKLRGSKEGRKGYLSLDAEISEVTPSFFVVELRKTGGDTIEYSKLCSEELRPSLKDIVWVWDGNSPENTV